MGVSFSPQRLWCERGQIRRRLHEFTGANTTGGVFREGNYPPLAFIIVLTSNKTVSMAQPLWDSLLCCNRWRRAFSLEGNLLQPMREPERES